MATKNYTSLIGKSLLLIGLINLAFPLNPVFGQVTENATSTQLVSSIGFDVIYDDEVELIPQTTEMSCWAASAAMIVGFFDQICLDPEEIANAVGYWANYHLPDSLGGGLPPDDTTMLSNWHFRAEPPMSYTVEAFRDLLELHGPLWVAVGMPGAHIIVVTGISGDGTPDGTWVHINDPWERGMEVFRPNNRGSRYRLTYRQFIALQEDLAVREMHVDAPIYIAHMR